MSNYHNRIMNIQTNEEKYESMEGLSKHAFKLGHRDARHAAAEIALEAEREIENLINESREDSFYIMSLENDLCNLKEKMRYLESKISEG